MTGRLQPQGAMIHFGLFAAHCSARARSCVLGGCVLWLVMLTGVGQASTWNDALHHVDSLCLDRRYNSASAAITALAVDASVNVTPADTAMLPVLYRIGDHFVNDGRLQEARTSYGLAIAIIRRAATEEPTAVVREASGEAFRRGQYIRAEIFARHVIEEWTTTDHPELTRAMVLLGNILLNMYRHEDAEQQYRMALEHARLRYGENDHRTARAEWGLANLYFGDQRPAEAEPLYRRALNTYIAEHGESHAAIPALRLNLGMIYLDLRQYRRAADETRAALAAFENADPPRLGGISGALSTMANIAHAQNDFESAEQYLLRALEAETKGYGPNNPWTNRRRAHLTEFYLTHDKIDEAERYQLEALRIADSLTGPHHPATTVHIMGLGRIRLAAGRLLEAESLFTRALEIRRESFGEMSPSASECLDWIVRCARRQGEWNRAVELSRKSLNIRQQLVREFSIAGAERDALLFAENVRNIRNLHLSSIIDRTGGTLAVDTQLAKVILVSKGDISDAVFQRRQFLAQPMDPKAEDLWHSYRMAQLELSNMFVRGPSDDDVAGFRAALDSMTMVVNEREARLAKHIASFGDARPQSQMSVADICKRLPEDAVLVEYLKYAYEAADGVMPDTPAYVVLVLDRTGVLALHNLGDADPVDNMVARYRQHFTNVARSGRIPGRERLSEYYAIADSLYQFLWFPVAASVSGHAVVFVAPDGELNRVSFATLKTEGEPYLIESAQIHYLSAGRDLIRLHDSVPSGSGLLAVANPDFMAAGVSGTRTSPASVPTDRTVSMSDAIPKGFQTRCQEFGDLELQPLPTTEMEVEEVMSIWNAESSSDCVVMTGQEATETSFKKHAQGRRAIHLATHGYFLPTRCASDESDMTRGSSVLNESVPNPLLQSGLFLAGCAAPSDQRDSNIADDGVLTASEIAAMDFHGTDLVVLSACETGMGALRSGEGVYGLRRAFQIAGARTVVSTLWSIADEFTAPMLPTLYRQADTPLPARLQASQRKWLKWLRDRGFADHPYTWGAFIAEGSWN